MKTLLKVLEMLPNLIIYLHAGHLKMVDVHFLRRGGDLEERAFCTLWKMVDNYG